MNQIKIFNTLSSQKEAFKAINAGKVSIYNCGPTVYDTVHIGNLRTFVMDDIVRRVFEYNTYEVTQIMNITDIDDKTIRKSLDEKKPLKEVTLYYEDLFLADIKALNILTPHRLLHATDYIKEMIEMISKLLEKEIAYKAEDSVYFSIKKFKEYGKIAKIDITNEVKERIDNDEYDKENPKDFSLWKFDEDGYSYDAPFGKGRPGWHIECSAMAVSVLGSTIDVHTGGVDLLFPHHTNEIAQSESVTGQTFVNYWIHGAFMNINDDKMSKSTGNILKLKDLEESGVSPLAFRYWLLTSHYRTQVNFSLEAVKSAQTAFIRLVDTLARLGEISPKDEHIHPLPNPRDYRGEFLEKINDDFNIPEAVALVWDLVKDHSIEARDKVDMILDFDRVFGLGLKVVFDMKKEIPEEVKVLAEEREKARSEKDWDKADALRKEIESRGFDIKDENNGYVIS